MRITFSLKDDLYLNKKKFKELLKKINVEIKKK